MHGTATSTGSRGTRGWEGVWDHPMTAAVAIVIAAVLVVAVPALVTGTDPTRIPLAALIVAPFAAVATGFLAIAQVRAGASPIY